MNHELTGDSDREERRNHVLLAYVEALEEGRKPDRAQLLAAHPDLRQDLEAFLAGHDEVARLTAPLRAEQGDARPRRPDARGAGRHPSGHRRARRLSPPARGGPWRDGRRLRGRTDLAPAASRSRSCRSPRPSTRAASSGSRPRRWPRRTCSTSGSSRCTRSAASAASTTTRCSSSTDRASPHVLRDETDPNRARRARGPELAPSETRAEAETVLAAASFSRERSSDRRRYFDRVADLGRQAASRWSTLISWASCTGTSSRATCSWTCGGSSGSPTSAWPRSRAIPGSPSAGNSSARSDTPAPSNSWLAGGSSTTAAMFIRSGRRSTSS